MSVFFEVGHGVIDLTRTMAPTGQDYSSFLASTLEAIRSKEDLATILRHHRYLGNERDIAAASTWIKPRYEFSKIEDRLVVTGGTQATLLVLLGSLVGAGNLIATEQYTYPALMPLCRLLGIRVAGIAIDEEGIIPEHLEEICAKKRPKAVYLNPTIHNPTTITFSTERREAIARIAERYDLQIIEDDVHGRLVGPGPDPIASFAPERTWYILTLSKSLGIGLGVAYLVAPSASAMSLLVGEVQSVSAWFVRALPAAVATHFIESGIANSILSGVCDELDMRSVIVRTVLSGLEYKLAPRSLHVWLPLPRGWVAKEFLEASALAGIAVQGGDAFKTSKDDAPEGIRVSIGKSLSREELSHGLRIIRAILVED